MEEAVDISHRLGAVTYGNKGEAKNAVSHMAGVWRNSGKNADKMYVWKKYPYTSGAGGGGGWKYNKNAIITSYKPPKFYCIIVNENIIY